MKKFWYRDDIGLIKFRPTRFTASPRAAKFSVRKEDNMVKLLINLILNLRFLFAYSIYISEVDQDQQAYKIIENTCTTNFSLSDIISLWAVSHKGCI